MSLAQSYAFIMKKGSAKVLMEVGNMFQANKTKVFMKKLHTTQKWTIAIFSRSKILILDQGHGCIFDVTLIPLELS